MTGLNGLATPAVSGWQATQDPRNTQGNYGDKLNTGLSTMERYNRYKDPYANDVRDSYRDLKDFSYNPDSDREFQAYKDRLGVKVNPLKIKLIPT